MELTILLSKVFGFYFVVIGIIMLFRRGYFYSVRSAFAEQPVLRFMMGLIMFFGGLFMVISHQDWSNFTTGFISFLGWAVTVKALLFMNLSNHAVKRWTGWYKLDGSFGWVAGLLVIAIGLYLLNFSFGWY